MSVPLPPNLVIQKLLSPAAPTAMPGDQLRYVIAFQNNGTAAVSNVVVTDTIPANTQVILTSQGVSPVGGVLTWNVSTLNVGQSGSVAMVVQVNANTPDQTQIVNQATISVPAQRGVMELTEAGTDVRSAENIDPAPPAE